MKILLMLLLLISCSDKLIILKPKQCFKHIDSPFIYSKIDVVSNTADGIFISYSTLELYESIFTEKAEIIEIHRREEDFRQRYKFLISCNKYESIKMDIINRIRFKKLEDRVEKIEKSHKRKKK